MAARFREKDQRANPFERLNLADALAFGFSWMLVTAIGLMPMIDTILQRPPSISMQAAIVFFTAVASAVVLRRQYSWIGLVLHIFGQILIWLSILVMSLAMAIYLND